MPQHLEGFSTGLRPEAQLLLCCARTQIDDASAVRISRLLQENIDWGYLLQMAFRHRLVALFYRNVESVAPASVPEVVRAELKEQIQVDIQGALFLTKELLHVLASFDQHGISALPYKGPVLALSVYRDLALRPFEDLDILVHERDVLRAMNVLVSCGYEIIRPRHVAQAEERLQELWVSQLVRRSLSAYQLVLWHPDRQVTVELHWRLMPKFTFPGDPEPLWDDLRTVTVAGVDVRSLAPENLLWFLCIHGAKHRWRQLNWLCDIAELIRVNPDLDWERIITRATALGAERRLLLGLLLADGLLQTPLPETIETKVYSAPHVKILARQVVEKVFDSAEQTAGLPHLEHFAFELRAIDRIADRGRYVLRFVKGIDAAATAGRAFAKPLSIRSRFSYLIRPLRLVMTYGLSPVMRLLKGAFVAVLGIGGVERKDVILKGPLEQGRSEDSLYRK